MKRKISRQGLVITVRELRRIADELEKEVSNDEIKIQINIVNPTPECSDTWEFEK